MCCIIRACYVWLNTWCSLVSSNWLFLSVYNTQYCERSSWLCTLLRCVDIINIFQCVSCAEMLLIHLVWFVTAVGECWWLMLTLLRSFWTTIVNALFCIYGCACLKIVSVASIWAYQNICNHRHIFLCVILWPWSSVGWQQQSNN